MGTEFLGNRVAQTTFETAQDIPLTNDEYSDLSFLNAYQDSYTNVFGRSLFGGVGETGARSIPLSQAKERATSEGLGDIFKSHSGDVIDEDRFNTMMDYSRDRRYIEQQLSRGPETTTGAIRGVGSMLAGGLSDPVGIAAGVATSVFVPEIAAARVATFLKSASGPVNLAARRAAIGAAEGVAETALLEPLYYYARNNVSSDYTVYDSFMNLAFGGALGGSISAGGGALGDLFKKTDWGPVMSKIDLQDQVDILMAAVKQLQATGKVDITPVLNAAVKKKLMYDLSEITADPELKKLLDADDLTTLMDRKITSDILSSDPDMIRRLEQADVDLKVAQSKLEGVRKQVTETDQMNGNDYMVYKEKIERAAETQDPRVKKRLLREASDMDKAQSNAFSKFYEAQQKLIIDETAQFDSVKSTFDNQFAEVNLARNLSRIKLQDQYAREYDDALQLMSNPQNESLRNLKTTVDQIEKETTSLDATLDSDLDNLTEFYKLEGDRIESVTGQKFELDEPQFDDKLITKIVKNLTACMVS